MDDLLGEERPLVDDLDGSTVDSSSTVVRDVDVLSGRGSGKTRRGDDLVVEEESEGDTGGVGGGGSESSSHGEGGSSGEGDGGSVRGEEKGKGKSARAIKDS